MSFGSRFNNDSLRMTGVKVKSRYWGRVPSVALILRNMGYMGK